MTKEGLEGFLRTLDIWVIVFGVLVAIGVTVEAIVGFLHFRKGNQLHRMEVAENLAQQTEIERMKKESGLILERAASAEQQAAQAGGGTAKALAEAATANERSKKLELEAAEQRERAAKAEHDLLELQQKFKPRWITDEQRKVLIDALQRASVKGLITIDCVLGDGEGLAFATQINGILKASGWPTNGVNQGAYGGGNPIGLGVIVHAAQTAPPYAVALQLAFTNAGIPLPGAIDANQAEGTVKIVVGNKPQ